MHILILGGGGFLGHRLATTLLERVKIEDNTIKTLLLFDKAFPKTKLFDSRIAYVEGDITNKDQMQDLISSAPDLIFHLAAVVSGEAEKNLDLGMDINLHASLQLIELCRHHKICPRIVFASSCAVFGGDVTRPIDDFTAPKPRSSYGTQKAIVELLINDYSRRGIIDGRSLRLPTIAIRPGKANAATSSFVSSIIREPLNGMRAVCPVPPETEIWIQSPTCVISNFIHAAFIDRMLLEEDGIITLPGLTTSVAEMISGLEEVAGRDVIQLIDFIPDSFLQSIVLTWPPHYVTERSIKMGFVRDKNIVEIINSYISEEDIKLPQN